MYKGIAALWARLLSYTAVRGSVEMGAGRLKIAGFLCAQDLHPFQR